MCVRGRGDGCSTGEICSHHKGNIKECLGGNSSISLSRSPPLLLPCFAISHRCILSCLTRLFPPPSISPPSALQFAHFQPLQLRRASPQLCSRFLTLGSMQEISPPLEFRGPAGSACHRLKIISLLTHKQYGQKLIHITSKFNPTRNIWEIINPNCTTVKCNNTY